MLQCVFKVALILIGQLRWSFRCLKQYTESPPFKTNLDPFVEQIRKDLKCETKMPKDDDVSDNYSKSMLTFVSP